RAGKVGTSERARARRPERIDPSGLSPSPTEHIMRHLWVARWSAAIILFAFTGCSSSDDGAVDDLAQSGAAGDKGSGVAAPKPLRGAPTPARSGAGATASKPAGGAGTAIPGGLGGLADSGAGPKPADGPADPMVEAIRAFQQGDDQGGIEKLREAVKA